MAGGIRFIIMFNGITFWTDDKIWRGILTDLGAQFSPRESANVIFKPSKKLSPTELNAEILHIADSHESEILKKICKNENLSGTQKKIVIALYNAGTDGIDAVGLQQKLGYAAGASTNAVGTAIYQLRKTFGKDFIKSEGGKYKL